LDLVKSGNVSFEAEHYTGGRPMTCPVCIKTLSQYYTPNAEV
jgi:hypothetical protein